MQQTGPAIDLSILLTMLDSCGGNAYLNKEPKHLEIYATKHLLLACLATVTTKSPAKGIQKRSDLGKVMGYILQEMLHWDDKESTVN